MPVQAKKIRLGVNQIATLQRFRRTGHFAGKDAYGRYLRPRSWPEYWRLHRLRKLGLIDHFVANQWHITDAGKAWLEEKGL